MLRCMFPPLQNMHPRMFYGHPILVRVTASGLAPYNVEIARSSYPTHGPQDGRLMQSDLVADGLRPRPGPTVLILFVEVIADL
jgi:hypothetical protein